MTEQPRSNASDDATVADASDDALTREVAALFDVEPSPAFAARVRARVQADRELRRAWWTRPAMVAAAAAAVVVAVAIGVDRPGNSATEPAGVASPSRAARVRPLRQGSAPTVQAPAQTAAGARAGREPDGPERQATGAMATPPAMARATPRPGHEARARTAQAARVAARAPDAAGFSLFLRRLSDGTLSGPGRLPSGLVEYGPAPTDVVSRTGPDAAPQAAPLTVPPLEIAPLAIASAAGDTE